MLHSALVALRYRGRPVERDLVEGLYGSAKPLVLIPAGTTLDLVEVSGWVDWQFDSTGSFLRFALPDRRTMAVTVGQWDDPGWLPLHLRARGGRLDAGLLWRDLLIAAMVVPVRHVLAQDDKACRMLIDRIEQRVYSPASMDEESR